MMNLIPFSSFPPLSAPPLPIPLRIRLAQRIEFERALRWQQRALEKVRSSPSPYGYLFLIEHRPVFSLGRSGDGSALRVDPALLAERGIAWVRADRGGDLTYHGPGQWTLYPILPLAAFCKDIHRYLRLLEEVGIRYLAYHGIEGERRKGRTGVWVGRDKIIAMGIAARRWISYHGMAVNIQPDLSFFRDWMYPCGIPPSEGGVTSLAELTGRCYDMQAEAQRLIAAFTDVLPFTSERTTSLPSSTAETTVRSFHPPWITKRLSLPAAPSVKRCLDDLCLHTVCQSARCPNASECFTAGRATFLLLGPICTRNCGFCAVEKGSPPHPVDPTEPERIAAAAVRLGLRHVVITSVTRDDLADGGATHFARTVEALRRSLPHATIEILPPDFAGNRQAWETVADAQPDVLNHNLETISRLYPAVRPGADYGRSLAFLRFVKDRHPTLITKSGIMVGLGETVEEVLEVGRDLRQAGVEMITIGQYLRPSSTNLPVARFLPPEEFERLASALKKLGFGSVAAAPFVRSSYHAEEAYHALSISS